jgi:ribosomal protein S12 methylthiotransferase
MNRGATVENTRALIRKLRDRVPDLALRSSVIAGFPGEKEEHVQELLEFIEEIRFNRLVGFLYSHEEGTSAGLLEDGVPEDEKRDRLDRILSLQAVISSEITAECVGRTYAALVDRPADDPAYDYIGRTRMDAPEIDGEVFISGEARIGEFTDVEITDALDHDLIGRSTAAPQLLDIAAPRPI